MDAESPALHERAPEHGASIEAILDPLFNDWIPRSFGTPSPGYLAYIPGGGVYASALADFIATATNRYVGVSGAAPALAVWLRLFYGLDPGFCRGDGS